MAIEEFIQAMAQYAPADSRIMFCQFPGDPSDVEIRGRWRARVLDDPRLLNPKLNVYLCVSAMRRNGRGEFRRRKENFAGGLLLMIDDLGSGPGAKFPLEKIDVLKPTALIETSPENFQAVYMFDSLVADIDEFDSLIRAFIKAQFLGKDTGMAGVNRVFRPPCGINGKAKYDGWQVRMTQWSPECRYSPTELAAAFGLELRPPPVRPPRGATVDRAANVRHFIAIRSMLDASGMLKQKTPDLGGWQQITCPWTNEHTGAVDNGAAIRVPDFDNGWCGAFKCHHGACEERAWRDLTAWIADHDTEILEQINLKAERL